MEEILKCDHSYESYGAVRSLGFVYYAIKRDTNFRVCGRKPKMWPFPKMSFALNIVKWHMYLFYYHLCLQYAGYVYNLRVWGSKRFVSVPAFECVSLLGITSCPPLSNDPFISVRSLCTFWLVFLEFFCHSIEPVLKEWQSPFDGNHTDN